MPRLGSTPLSFPDFHGATRRLVLINLAAFFALAIALQFPAAAQYAGPLSFAPHSFLQGWLWQPFTYSLIHPQILGTLFELLSIWFLAGFLEAYHTDSWVTNLYIISVLGTAAAALILYLTGSALHLNTLEVPLYGCFGGIFGLLTAIGILYGDVEFLMFFVIGIKARYMAIIYGLVAIAYLFGSMRMYAFAQLGGAIAAYVYIRFAPRRGFNFVFSEKLYGLRNRYYRWKRRRAARKFEVYMRSQGKTVRFDGNGRQIEEDQDDKKRWN